MYHVGSLNSTIAGEEAEGADGGERTEGGGQIGGTYSITEGGRGESIEETIRRRIWAGAGMSTWSAQMPLMHL